MHFCTYVFIPPKGEIETLVADALHLYSEDLEVPPYEEYLDGGEIDIMSKHYGVRHKNLKALVSHMKDWSGTPGGVDERGLFRIKTMNPEGRWDWYEIGGRWSGCFRGNVISAKALLEKKNLKDILPAFMVTPDGSWHEWETFVTEGWMKWHVEKKKDGEWMKIIRDALAAYPNFRVACVDIHK
ncbi:MAG: hypothetical protein AAB728_05255 [Patescibacteria group bacterium]